MKGTKPSELREKSVEDLTRLANEKAENLFNLKVRLAAGTLDSSADVRTLRRDLARVRTVLNEKLSAAARAQA